MTFSHIIKDKYLRVVAGLSVLLLILAGLIFYLGIGTITTPLIIHFDPYKGIDFLGSKTQVWGIILAVLVIILINLFLADFLYNRERFLAYIFVFAGLLLAILILIVISVIINVNT